MSQVASSGPEHRPVVRTSLGDVRGLADAVTGITRFLGIPYADVPTGDLRFRPPAPARPWNGIRDASRFGDVSAQPFDPREAPLDDYFDGPPPATAPAWVGSEDCLTLNVWTSLQKPLRPLVIWIHGGANWLEGSRLSVYDGGMLAARGGVVVASLNYRLGLFGFLDVSGLGGEEYRGTHSLGLMDQLAAIEWLAANASAFGADGGNITLVGESAGSMDISWLLTTGRLPAGVRRTVLMSGIAGLPGVGGGGERSFYQETEGRRQAAEVWDLLQIRSMDELLQASTEDLLTRLTAALPQRDMLFFWDSLFYPRIDGKLLRETPFEFVASGKAKHLQLMIGATAYEMGLWLMWDSQLDHRPARELAARLPGLAPDFIDTLAVRYAKAFPSETGGMQLLGDAMFVMPGVLLAQSQDAAGGSAWLYEFAWSFGDSRMRASHAADVGFFLGTWRSRGAEALIGAAQDASDEKRRAMLSDMLQDMLLNFVACGEPGELRSGEALIPWPRYDQERRAVMRFDVTSEVLYDPHAERRSWWLTEVYATQRVRSADPG